MSAINKQHKMERADIVIVGNGIAGLTTAVEARRLAEYVKRSVPVNTSLLHRGME